MSDRSWRSIQVVAFLANLIPFLSERGQVSVTETAKQFDVSPERVREAVRLIALSGVPGDTKAYLPGDLFDIAWDLFEEEDEILLTHEVALGQPARFSAREASALIAGLQYLAATLPNKAAAQVDALIDKLSRGATAAPNGLAIADTTPAPVASTTLQNAIEADRAVAFQYRNSRGEVVLREVDPQVLESQNRDWYLHSWDRARQAQRTFRLDRMSDLQVLEQPRLVREQLEGSESFFTPGADAVSVTVKLPAHELQRLGDYVSADSEVTQNGEDAIVKLPIAHFGILGSLVARFSGALTVIEPAAARQAVADFATAALKNYR